LLGNKKGAHTHTHTYIYTHTHTQTHTHAHAPYTLTHAFGDIIHT
jgi:hypothetical protein